MLKKSNSNSKNNHGAALGVQSNKNKNDDNDDIVVSSGRSSSKSIVKLDANFPIAANLHGDKNAQKSTVSKQRKLLARERWSILKKVRAHIKFI
jgi:hypothetical protein